MKTIWSRRHGEEVFDVSCCPVVGIEKTQPKELMRGKAVLKPGSDVHNVVRFLRPGNKSGEKFARDQRNVEERCRCPKRLRCKKWSTALDCGLEITAKATDGAGAWGEENRLIDLIMGAEMVVVENHINRPHGAFRESKSNWKEFDVGWRHRIPRRWGGEASVCKFTQEDIMECAAGPRSKREKKKQPTHITALEIHLWRIKTQSSKI